MLRIFIRMENAPHINTSAKTETNHDAPVSPKCLTPQKTVFYVIALFLGSISALALPPWHIIPGFFVGVAGLYILLRKTHSFKQGMLTGWFWGFGYFTIGLYWIGNALLVDGNDYAWAYPLAVCGLPAFLAFFLAIATGCLGKYAKLQSLSGFCIFCITLFMSEWLRGHAFSGFPWNLYGYIWAEHLEVLQILPYGKIYALSFLTLFWAASIGFALTKQRKITNYIPIILALISFTANYIYGKNVLSHAPAISSAPLNLEIKVVQPNIAQAVKWDRNQIWDHFNTLLTLSTYEGTHTHEEESEDLKTLIIWPETAISFMLLENAVARATIQDILNQYPHKATLITGALLRNKKDKTYSNSIITIDQTGQITNTYNKSHLVPFGEYIPFQNWIPLPTITQFQGFKKGDNPKPIQIYKNIFFTPLICYEIIFPGFIQKKSSLNKRLPNLIVNVTNDAWYGDSAGPYQHLVHSQYRAIEERNIVIRAANTGISNITDSYGRFIDKKNLKKKGTILARL